MRDDRRRGRESLVDGEPRRRGAAVLLILAWALWWHAWVPALLVSGIVSWGFLHQRLEGDLGAALVRIWRRAWPPGTLALIPLLFASMFVFWTSDVPSTPKALPVALSMLGLATILLHASGTLFAHVRRLWRARTAPALDA